MSKQTEALKLALEAFEAKGDAWIVLERKAITAIREALAEQPAQQDMPKIGCVNHDCDKCKAQQQEPVAWMWMLDGEVWDLCSTKDRFTPIREGHIQVPLYTSPPASKPKNVMRVKRISDQSVELVFTSCAAASEFIVAHGIKGEQK